MNYPHAPSAARGSILFYLVFIYIFVFNWLLFLFFRDNATFDDWRGWIGCLRLRNIYIYLKKCRISFKETSERIRCFGELSTTQQLHHPISYRFPPQTTKSRSEIYLKSLQSPKKCYQSSYPAIYLIKSLNLSQTSKTFTVKAHIMRIILNNPYKFIQYILNYHKVSRLPNPIPNFDHTP